jgi:hypothetical protein
VAGTLLMPIVSKNPQIDIPLQGKCHFGIYWRHFERILRAMFSIMIFDLLAFVFNGLIFDLPALGQRGDISGLTGNCLRL